MEPVESEQDNKEVANHPITIGREREKERERDKSRVEVPAIFVIAFCPRFLFDGLYLFMCLSCWLRMGFPVFFFSLSLYMYSYLMILSNHCIP